MIYQTVNQAVLKRLPWGLQSLLDLGCGGGAFGQAAKAATGCHVTGVTWSQAEARAARRHLDTVVVADLDALDPAPLGRFDGIVCSHVLEHLRAPEQLLTRLQACLNPGATLVVAPPNVLFWKQRQQFLRGRFRYTEGSFPLSRLAGAALARRIDGLATRHWPGLLGHQFVLRGTVAVTTAAADGGRPA